MGKEVVSIKELAAQRTAAQRRADVFQTWITAAQPEKEAATIQSIVHTRQQTDQRAGAVRPGELSVPKTFDQTTDDPSSFSVNSRSERKAVLRLARFRSTAVPGIQEMHTRYTEEIALMNAQIEGYGEAQRYFDELTEFETDLAEMREYAAAGAVSPSNLAAFEAEFNEFTARPETDEALRLNLERLKAEKAKTDTQAKTVFTNTETQEEAPAASPAMPTEIDLKGMPGEVARLLAAATADNPLAFEQLAATMYPDIPIGAALERVEVHFRRAQAWLQKSGQRLGSVATPDTRYRGRRGQSFYLVTGDEAQPTEEGYRIDKRTLITGLEGKILTALDPIGPEHIVTREEILRAIGADDVAYHDPRILDELVKNVNGVIKNKRLRVVDVRNPRDARNRGYFVEHTRRRVGLELLGEVVRYGNKQVVLTDDERKLFWRYSDKVGHARFDIEMARRVLDEKDSTASQLPAVLSSLKTKLAELTGVDDILAAGGNQEFGHFHRIKDARVKQVPEHFPVHTSRLDAFDLILSDAPAESIITTLGLTRDNQRHTWVQAYQAIRHSLTTINNRVTENIEREREGDIYVLVEDFIVSHGLGDNVGFLNYIKDKLRTAYEATLVSPEAARQSDTQASNETRVLPPAPSTAVGGEVFSAPKPTTSSRSNQLSQRAAVDAESAAAPTNKSYGIERKHPFIRKKADTLLTEVENRPDFKQPVNSSQITRVYGRLTTAVIENARRAGHIRPVGYDRDNDPLYDAEAIAILLYLSQHKQLPSRLKGDVKDVFSEENQRRIKEREEAARKAQTQK